MDVLEVMWTSWVSWPIWTGFGMLAIAGIIERYYLK
jgi:hypothetical protein